MALIDKPQGTVQEEVTKIKEKIADLHRVLCGMHTEIFNDVWKNEKFTPKQLVEGFGTDAADLFTDSYTLQTVLKRADSDYQLLSPTEPVTFNSDGSATVGVVAAPPVTPDPVVDPVVEPAV